MSRSLRRTLEAHIGSRNQIEHLRHRVARLEGQLETIRGQRALGREASFAAKVRRQTVFIAALALLGSGGTAFCRWRGASSQAARRVGLRAGRALRGPERASRSELGARRVALDHSSEKDGRVFPRLGRWFKVGLRAVAPARWGDLMAWDSKSSLTALKARVSPFGVEWRRRTGRHLTTARDGLDFLVAMRDRDDFWAALLPSDPSAALPVDLAALRAALPAQPLPREVAAEEVLRSVGLSPSEIDAVVGGLDASDLIDGAIRSAFEERSPQKIARALERVLDTDRGVLATERYVGRLAESRGIGRTLGLLMGTVILLVGTTLAACGPQSESPTPTRTTPTSEQNERAEPAPAPNGESAETAQPEPPPPEPPPPEPPPNSTPVPVPAYKGVSPRRRPAPRMSLS